MADAKKIPEVSVDILPEGIEIKDIQSTWEKLVQWGSDHFWTQDSLYQGVMLLCAFLIAGIAYHFIGSPLKEKIENSRLPYHLKRMAEHTRRLLFPLIALIILSIENLIAGPIGMEMDVPLTHGVAKVLLAWIAIRFFTQFIKNRLVRNIIAFTIWTMAALSIFGILGQTAATLDSIAFTFGDFRLSLLIVFKSIFSLFILLYLAFFAAGLAERKIYQVTSLTRSSQVLIAKVLRVTLIVCALLIGITSAGIDLSLFAVFGGAIGLGIGFGLQKGISNLFSGMLLLLDQSIKPGDVIEIPDIGTFGWVNNMAARYTEIVTRDNKSFLIPNEDFITQRVVNWSHGNSLVRIHLPFGVHYNSNPHEVTKVAIEAAKALERVVDDPAPVCWVTEFGDSSINFDLRFWIKDAEGGVGNIRGLVFLALWDAFKENGIEIPYPHREVYIHDADKDADKKADKEKPKKKKAPE